MLATRGHATVVRSIFAGELTEDAIVLPLSDVSLCSGPTSTALPQRQGHWQTVSLPVNVSQLPHLYGSLRTDEKTSVRPILQGSQGQLCLVRYILRPLWPDVDRKTDNVSSLVLRLACPTLTDVHRITQHVFTKLYENGYFVRNTAKQPYCLKDQRCVQIDVRACCRPATDFNSLASFRTVS
jgi:hypothetical protein